MAYAIDESNAFLDGSSYLETAEPIRYPLNYGAEIYGTIDYRNSVKINVWSKHAGTAHVFIRYK